MVTLEYPVTYAARARGWAVSPWHGGTAAGGALPAVGAATLGAAREGCGGVAAAVGLGVEAPGADDGVEPEVAPDTGTLAS